MNEHRSVRLPAVAVAAAGGIWLGGHSVWSTEVAPWVAVAVVAWAALWRRPLAQTLVAVALLAAALGARARTPQPAPVGEVVVDDRGADVIEGWVSGPITATRRGIAFELDQGGARVRVTAERAAVLPGDRVRVTGRVMTARGARNPGAMDRVLFAQARGSPWEMHAQRLELVTAGDRVSAWRWPSAFARDASARVAARGGDREGNALVRAAVLGDRSGLDDDTDAAWRAAGVYHALSVSGLHLAAVALVAFVGIGWLWALSGLGARIAPRRAAAAFALPLSLAYTLVTGAQIATVRAMVVVGVMLVGELLGRHARASDALGLAALVVLLLSPLAIHDPGFQLSFVAAATLVVAAGQRGHFVVRALRTSLAVSLATAPITAWHFHEVAIGGVIGNLIATPLVELVTIPIGLAGLVLGGPVIDLAVAIAGITAAIVARLGALTPSILVPPPSPLELLACAALYAAWAGARLGWLTRRHALAGAAVAALVLAASWAARAHDRATDDTLRVTFLDVGQGDAAVIELPGGAVWLVDAGGSPGGGADELRVSARPGEEIARFLRARRITRVDVAIVSHPHPDHYLGLAALAPRIPIRELWSAVDESAGDGGADAGAFTDLAAWLARGGTSLTHPALGPHVVGDVTVRVWGPVYDAGYGARPTATADPVRSVNDNSLVLTVERAGRCVLFTGDLEEEGEANLVAARVGRCDVVKVPHHGSPTSSSAALVDATRPAWAIMSLGRGNRFGFPAPAVVARWEAAGAGVLRTDVAGAITVTIDRDGTLEVATFD
ncbi:MAG TPA: DNA internalization-related competence protein ComEC/Rec2 [Kofleriaceae bacterium]|nr:DNA internalization-related competence protein ComEC/Rec2 [Kofleriaceae bacterium]